LFLKKGKGKAERRKEVEESVRGTRGNEAYFI